MPTLATNTYYNNQIINEQNGVLVNDDCISVCNGFYELVSNFRYFDTSVIKNSIDGFYWHQITKDFIEILGED